MASNKYDIQRNLWCQIYVSKHSEIFLQHHCLVVLAVRLQITEKKGHNTVLYGYGCRTGNGAKEWRRKFENVHVLFTDIFHALNKTKFC